MGGVGVAATGSTWVIKLITELVELLMKNDYRGAIFGGGQGRAGQGRTMIF